MSKDKRYQDKDWLKGKYKNERLTQEEIANKCGIGLRTVGYWMDKFGIETRGYDEDAGIDRTRKNKRYKHKTWLKEQYINKQLSTAEIAKMEDTSKNTIWYWLNKFNIETRGMSAVNQLLNKRDDSLYKDKTWLKEQYIDKDLSTYQIAEKVNCSAQTISRWLGKFDIKINKQPSEVENIIKTCPVCGEKFEVNPSSVDKYKRCSQECYNIDRRKNSDSLWSNVQHGYRGPNWKKQRKKTLKRDNYTCQVCGVTNSETILHVHHIVKFLEYRYPIFKGNEIKNIIAEFDWKRANRLENLITVCASCHREVEGKDINEYLIKDKTTNGAV